MKTFLRYAWPVLGVMAFQVLICFTTHAKTLRLAILRIAVFALVDFTMGWGQWWQYRQAIKFKAELDAIRARRGFGS